MTKDTEYRENSPAVQAHLTIVQAVIARMASNSAACKAWCIALVSAVLVVVADKGKPDYVWIAAIPTILFLVLDAYYLALERAFREAYNQFIDRLHAGGIRPSDLYAVVPSASLLGASFRGVGSFSVWPMYITLLGMIYLVRRFVL